MAERKLKLVVFISGRGSNMEALMKACENPSFPAEIVAVLSNRPGAKGLETARARNIPTLIVDHKEFEGRKTFELSILSALAPYDFDLICLAGFMRILSASFIEKFPKKIINIHPSLLPAYKGLETHTRVLADKQKKTGCSVHYVVPEMDSGPLILQKEVTVQENDTPDTLAARVLEQEHIAYPEAIKIIAKDILNA